MKNVKLGAIAGCFYGERSVSATAMGDVLRASKGDRLSRIWWWGGTIGLVI